MRLWVVEKGEEGRLEFDESEGKKQN